MNKERMLLWCKSMLCADICIEINSYQNRTHWELMEQPSVLRRCKMRS